jgi:hypothetical protein
MKNIITSVAMACSLWAAFPATSTAEMVVVGPVVENITGAPLAFGQVASGSSAQVTLGGVNNTPYTMMVYAALGGPDASHFAITNGCSGIPLMPGASCFGTVAFNPHSLGQKNAELIIVMRGVIPALPASPPPGGVSATPMPESGADQFLHIETHALSGTGM